MTPPRREDRLNPMSRRRGRPPGPPPGPEWMVLGTTITCTECGWVGLEMDSSSAIEAWKGHAALKHPELSTDQYTVEESQ